MGEESLKENWEDEFDAKFFTFNAWGHDNLKVFICRVAAEARYEGAVGCAEAVDAGIKDFKCAKNEEEFGGHLTARGHWWGRDESIKAAQEYANSLKPGI